MLPPLPAIREGTRKKLVEVREVLHKVSLKAMFPMAQLHRCVPAVVRKAVLSLTWKHRAGCPNSRQAGPQHQRMVRSYCLGAVSLGKSEHRLSKGSSNHSYRNNPVPYICCQALASLDIRTGSIINAWASVPKVGCRAAWPWIFMESFPELSLMPSPCALGCRGVEAEASFLLFYKRC